MLAMASVAKHISNVGNRNGLLVSGRGSAFLVPAITHPVINLSTEFRGRLSPDFPGEIQDGLLGEGIFHAFLRRHHDRMDRAMA